MLNASSLLARQTTTTGWLVTSYAPVAPVLKGINDNALLCVKLYVPAGKPALAVNGLTATLNAGGLQAIEGLTIYNNGNEPQFNNQRSITTLTPTTTQFFIPARFTATTGWNYIWISAQLKPQASITGKLELHITRLQTTQGVLPVKEENKGFAKYIGIALRKAGDDSVHTYRIPGLTTTGKGTLIAVYDIRYKHSGDLPANIDVGMSRSTDGGKTWSPMKIIMDMGAPQENNGVGDPAVLFDPVTNKIWVAALWSKGNRSIAGSMPGLSPDTTGQLVLVSSDDDGITWTAPVSITNQVKDPAWHLYFNGPGSGIAMQNGTLVFASQYWDESRKPGIPHAAIIYSTDHGATWHSGKGAKSNTTESQVVETQPGTLMLNMRDNRGNFRSIATTQDMGNTWVEHTTSYNALPDPVCMAALIKATVGVKGKKQPVLFFSNVASQQTRMNMTIKASLNLGQSWPAANNLLIDERKLYGYSALSHIDDHTIGILYEGVRDLYFLRIPIADIIH
jgi:sialidase-1